MTYKGTIKNGMVLLEAGVVLPEGSQVRVEPVENRDDLSELREGLLRFAGCIKGLPRDSARDHDHYLYGADRK